MDRVRDSEIHFMQVEGELPRFKYTFGDFREALSGYGGEGLAKATEWTITDFDGALDGNPHL